MTMRMVSNRHVFGGSMKRFKRVPLVRKEYMGKPSASDSKNAVHDLESEINEAVENISETILEVEPENVAPVKKARAKKNKNVESSEDNNEIKNEHHE